MCNVYASFICVRIYFVKRLLKYIFIFLAFLITLCPNVQSAQSFAGQNVLAPAILESASHGFLHESAAREDYSIVAVNNSGFEISAINDRKDIFANGSLDKGCAQNKFIQQVFSSKYNQTITSKSHNISSYLKNEICTRGP